MPRLSDTHIAVLLYGLYPPDSRVRRQSEALVAMGYSVDVIALRGAPKQGRYTLNGVTVWPVPMLRERGNAFSYCLRYAGFFVLTSAWLTVLFIKRRYKLIHVNNMPDFIVFCALLPRLCGARVVLDIHDPFPELFGLKLASRSGRALGPVLRFEERMSTAFVNHIITTTELIATTLISRRVPRDKITVIMNTPDPHLFDPAHYPGIMPAAPDEEFIILFAGTVVKRNGLDHVVRMLPHLRSRMPQCRFRIIGTGDYVDELMALVAQLQVEEMVELHPVQAVDAIPVEYLKCHAVFWFPERNPFIDIVMSTKVIEALAMGVPVVTTRTPCLEFYFPHDDVTFLDSLAPKVLAAAALELYQHYDQRRASPDQTARFRERFAWQGELANYEELIRGLSGRAAI